MNNSPFELKLLTENQLRLVHFAEEYRILCQKYNLYVDSCGCCNSPYLSEIVPTTLGDIIEDLTCITPKNIEARVEALLKTAKVV